jgi:hypothetical protein
VFPDTAAPAYLLRDHDHVHGAQCQRRVKGTRINDVLKPRHSRWRHPFAERRVTSIRRACLNQAVVPGEQHLRRIPT